ncbi:uncharacterized protein LOC120457527 [Drosophila santomea]|uniref:uncharacterized protein LOC120457527 n=1 Tax=Drosophila santomea TaxID=129105 RepID=UPI00195453BE|nr:uncharacterized protein LOC120457527 [Drosophila santomea]
MKAKAQYKAALRILSRLKGKAALSPQGKAKLTWAEQRVAEGRLHFANLPNMASTGGFANKVEESLANKSQRSTERANKDAPGSKRRRWPKEAGPIPSIPKAKVLLPIAIQGDRALKLLQRQSQEHPLSEVREDGVGHGSLFLRLKKRHPENKDTHTLKAGEVEKDLGLETTTKAALGLSLNEADEEDGSLTLTVNPSNGDEPSKHATEGAAAQSS